jgi:trans-aconitate 2-methyltransferase
MYRWNPEEYSRHSTEQAKWARELIAKLNLQGTERGLDIG